MASENAKAVAQEVLVRVRKGQKVVLGEIIKEQGYSESVSESPTKVTRTKTYQQEMASFTELLDKEITKIQLEMDKRDISQERYVELAKVLDTLYKNKQLSTGGSTENQTINISIDGALAKRYGLDE